MTGAEMNFGWTDEQEAFRREVVRFAERELNDDLLQRDRDREFSRDAWKRCAAFGLQGLAMPERYGGGGADPVTIALALEGLGYGCRDNGLIFSLHAHMWACQMPILTFGTEEQKARWLPRLCDGSMIGSQAMTEPGSGSDAFGLRTTARTEDGHFVLNGAKTFASNAPVADVFVVFASTGAAKGFAGISAFLVPRDTPGLVIGRPIENMGLRTALMSELSFGDCRVPHDALLGNVGGGAAVFNTAMDWERSFILATAVGTMERQLERCVDYARSRKQFGQAIGKFQAVSHRIVNMKLRLKTARLVLHELAWLRSHGKARSPDAAMAKLHISECFLESSLDAQYVHGAYGYTADYELERDVRDAIGARMYSGTSDIQRNLVAGWMRL